MSIVCLTSPNFTIIVETTDGCIKTHTTRGLELRKPSSNPQTRISLPDHMAAGNTLSHYLDSSGDVLQTATRIVPNSTRRRLRIGLLCDGLDLALEAWPQERYLVYCRNTPDRFHNETLPAFPLYHQATAKHWKSFRRLDVLMVRQPTRKGKGNFSLADTWPQTAIGPESVWKLKPRILIVLQQPSDLIASQGNPIKDRQKYLNLNGYTCTQWFVPANKYQGVIDREYFITLATCQGDPFPPIPPSIDHDPTLRPMCNLLTPPGILNRKYLVVKPKSKCQSVQYRKGKYTHQTGVVLPHHEPLLDPNGPMLDQPFWVPYTDKHVRLIQVEEYAKALGITSTENHLQPTDFPTLRRLIEVHLFNYLLDPLLYQLRLRIEGIKMTHILPPKPENAVPTSTREPLFIWTRTLPDMREGSAWWKIQMHKLRQVALCDGIDIEKAITQGNRLLNNYRKSLTTEEVTLNLLWWNWPQLIRSLIRKGFPMNFVEYPPLKLSPNPSYTDVERQTAQSFVDELLSLGVLEPIPTHSHLQMNGPLSVIPKPNQPGQYRVISDMRRGGQNVHIGTDPVYNPAMSDILASLIPGGYTAIIDVAKEFYHFPIQEQDRNYLGLIHPVTSQPYRYTKCPMGSASSPGIANRAIATIMSEYRDLRSQEGDYVINNPLNPLLHLPYDAHLPEGLIHITSNRLPYAVIWIQVDDFLIHAPTHDTCVTELDRLLDFLFEKGILAHEKKVKPPAQVQTFCGFEFDTTVEPILKASQDKRTTAISIIDYLIHKKGNSQISKLTLAVAVGKLQSLCPATPQRVGSAYLRSLYNVIHADATVNPTDVLYYYQPAIMTDMAWSDLLWWKELLKNNPCHSHRPLYPGALVVPWGDGSGTGTGGSIQFVTNTTPETPSTISDKELWMAIWNPKLISSASSNWKELRTLLTSLQRETTTKRLYGRRVVYFTDNLVTYWIMHNRTSSSPGLHTLVKSISLLEATLRFVLEVVHVPGLTMISHGEDGQSRGLWTPAPVGPIEPLQIYNRLLAPFPWKQSMLPILQGLIEEHLPAIHSFPTTNK